MTEIKLYDTRTRRKVPFEPIDPQNVRMYVCGPTVYDRAHIGNARPVVVFDVLFRLLRHTCGADRVTYVRNLTDVDDKINRRAAETLKPGETELQAIRRITDETIGWFHDDMGELGTLPPTHEPRATEYIGEMVAMIETLVARGHAYEAEGHVLFEVATDPDYGTLARRNLEDMRAGARVEVALYKRDPMDFVLWKPSSDIQPGWDSPWGRGRPGWHIECSAMARDLLGDSFDIHGGGIDLAFPHHENECAQSRCAHPEGSFANIWMHNGFLNVEGEKMSKSLGNFFTVRDLLDKGVPGEVIRLVLLSTHYRQPINWTEARVAEAETVLADWSALTTDAEPSTPLPQVVAALAQDLDTPSAITAMHAAARNGERQQLLASMLLMGINRIDVSATYDVLRRVEALIAARKAARTRKDYAKSDIIRGLLEVAGIIVEDGRTPEWRLGFDNAPFGWMTASSPVADGKTLMTPDELKNLATVRHVTFKEDSRGHWTEAGLVGQPRSVDTEIIELAEREAKS